MGQRGASHNRAAAAITDECVDADGNTDNKRCVRGYWPCDEWLLLNNLDVDNEQAIKIAETIRKNVVLGTNYTAIADGKVISIGGVAIIGEGVGELWSVPSKEITRLPKFYYKVALWTISDSFKQLNLRRLQTICRYDDVTAYNWQKKLGFEFEGRMKAYNADGTDSVRTAMICGQQKTVEHY